MDPRAIIEDGVLVGWMFAPDDPDESDMTAFKIEDWHQMGFMTDDAVTPAEQESFWKPVLEWDL